MYIPMRQSNPLVHSQVYLIARGGRAPADLVAEAHDALRPKDSPVALNEVQVLQALVDKSVSPRRFLMLLVTGFAGFALGLASLGIYGVISYSMSQRRQEIGIRLRTAALATTARTARRAPARCDPDQRKFERLRQDIPYERSGRCAERHPGYVPAR